MKTASVFQADAGMESQLWRLTWDKIDTFLPHLHDDIFKPFEPGTLMCLLKYSLIVGSICHCEFLDIVMVIPWLFTAYSQSFVSGKGGK